MFPCHLPKKSLYESNRWRWEKSDSAISMSASSSQREYSGSSQELLSLKSSSQPTLQQKDVSNSSFNTQSKSRDSHGDNKVVRSNDKAENMSVLTFLIKEIIEKFTVFKTNLNELFKQQRLYVDEKFSLFANSIETNTSTLIDNAFRECSKSEFAKEELAKLGSLIQSKDFKIMQLENELEKLNEQHAEKFISKAEIISELKFLEEKMQLNQTHVLSKLNSLETTIESLNKSAKITGSTTSKDFPSNNLALLPPPTPITRKPSVNLSFNGLRRGSKRKNHLTGMGTPSKQHRRLNLQQSLCNYSTSSRDSRIEPMTHPKSNQSQRIINIVSLDPRRSLSFYDQKFTVSSCNSSPACSIKSLNLMED